MADSTRNDSVVKVLNVNVLDNPTCLTNPFQFEIVFESNRDLKEGKQFGGLVSIDLEWRLIYVGDHRTTDGDQVLDSILVGPVIRGTHKFCFQVVVLNFVHFRHQHQMYQRFQKIV